MNNALVFCLIIAGCNALQKQERRFPDDFTFGAATAAYQIEGGWNADDKTESIWDHMTHTKPTVIKDESNGDIAADSYNNYKRDVEMMRELGLDAYRFSFSWPRILPNGLANKVSEAGVKFYNNYIDEMIKYNITPMATIYHWDLPQKLQDMGGFANPMFPEWYEDYSRVLFKLFGDRVKIWITFNEPREVCYQGYGYFTIIPMLNLTDVGTYYCAKHLVLAHARAYHAYVDDFKDDQGGVCGYTVHIKSYVPETDSEEDKLATELKNQADWTIYTEPIFSSEGGFPKEISEIIAKKSAEQGYPRSRLPEFTEEEKAYVRGAYDFLGINHYHGFIVSATEYLGEYPTPSLYTDVEVGWYAPSEWLQGQSSWLKLTPNSLYHVLKEVHDRYNNPAVYITENGWSTATGDSLEDTNRITYYRAAWEDLLDALDEGMNVKGYMAWSLMDNYEWMQGYTERFGLYDVDFESPERTRTPRKSAFMYKQLIKTRQLEYDYEPHTMTMWIDEGH